MAVLHWKLSEEKWEWQKNSYSTCPIGKRRGELAQEHNPSPVYLMIYFCQCWVLASVVIYSWWVSGCLLLFPNVPQWLEKNTHNCVTLRRQRKVEQGTIMSPWVFVALMGYDHEQKFVSVVTYLASSELASSAQGLLPDNCPNQFLLIPCQEHISSECTRVWKIYQFWAIRNGTSTTIWSPPTKKWVAWLPKMTQSLLWANGIWWLTTFFWSFVYNTSVKYALKKEKCVELPPPKIPSGVYSPVTYTRSKTLNLTWDILEFTHKITMISWAC